MLKGTDLKVFLGVCKAVRDEQDWRKRANEHQKVTGSPLPPYNVSSYILVDVPQVYWVTDSGVAPKQNLAILFKLADQGYINYHRGHAKKCSKVQLTPKGVALVKQLREQLRSK